MRVSRQRLVAVRNHCVSKKNKTHTVNGHVILSYFRMNCCNRVVVVFHARNQTPLNDYQFEPFRFMKFK